MSLSLLLLLPLRSLLPLATAYTINDDNDDALFCPVVHEPVICGADEKYFTNSCFAHVAGFDPEEQCTPTNDDNYNYDDGNGYKMSYDDADAIFCLAIYEPVICGPKNYIFSNACIAEVEGGYNPDDDCIPYSDGDVVKSDDDYDDIVIDVCQEEFDPVICGPDDEIFDNDCYAKVGGGYNVERDCKSYLDYYIDDYDKDLHSACTRDYNPYMCGFGDQKKFFSNKCYIRKAGFDPDDSTVCAAFIENGEEDPTVDSLDCLVKGGAPVYCLGTYFINSCYASNAGYDVVKDCDEGGPKSSFEDDDDDIADDATSVKAADDGYYIICPDIWEPLNCEGTIYSNSCYAEIDGYTPLIDCISVSDGDDPDTEPACIDDSSFRFNLTTSHKERSCKWLTRKTISRKRNVCRDIPEVNVKCQHTCGTCSTSCGDNEIFTFSLRPGKVRSCKWLSRKDDERIRNVCTDIDGVTDECKLTCGGC